MRRLKFTLIVALLILIAASPKLAFAPTGDPDIVVPRLLIPVTLDGAITGGEWSDAAVQPVTFYFDDPGNSTRRGTIYLKHDCVNLWLCIEIEDPTENTDEWIAVFYDVSGDNYPSSLGDDQKGVLHPDETFDCAIIPVPPDYYDNDTDIGGTKDIQGASGWAYETLTYEFVHPLNSGDHAGNDPTLEPGGTILAQFMAGDPEIGEKYYSWNIYYDLNITQCPTPVGGTIIQNKIGPLTPILATLTTTVAIVSSAIIIHKRRKTSKS